MNPQNPHLLSPWSNLRVEDTASAEAWAEGWTQLGRETWAWVGPIREPDAALVLYLVGDRVTWTDLQKRVRRGAGLEVRWLGPAAKLAAPVESLVRAGCFEAVEAWLQESRAKL